MNTSGFHPSAADRAALLAYCRQQAFNGYYDELVARIKSTPAPRNVYRLSALQFEVLDLIHVHGSFGCGAGMVKAIIKLERLNLITKLKNGFYTLTDEGQRVVRGEVV